MAPPRSVARTVCHAVARRAATAATAAASIVVADPHLASLLDFKYKRHYKAERGEDGRNKDQYGAAGEDLTLKVPVGTVIYDEETQRRRSPISTTDGATFVLAKGGIGGKGNIHFKTPWNQAPRTAEPGHAGRGAHGPARAQAARRRRPARVPQRRQVDVHLARLARAPKVADYPFTTLVPNLGVVRLTDERTFVIADIPGLIEGASEGAGLGHQFLRHVERCRVLLHIVEATFTTGPGSHHRSQDFDVINGELAQYAPELANKPQVVVLNKVDAIDPKDDRGVPARVRASADRAATRCRRRPAKASRRCSRAVVDPRRIRHAATRSQGGYVRYG